MFYRLEKSAAVVRSFSAAWVSAGEDHPGLGWFV